MGRNYFFDVLHRSVWRSRQLQRRLRWPNRPWWNLGWSRQLWRHSLRWRIPTSRLRSSRGTHYSWLHPSTCSNLSRYLYRIDKIQIKMIILQNKNCISSPLTWSSHLHFRYRASSTISITFDFFRNRPFRIFLSSADFHDNFFHCAIFCVLVICENCYRWCLKISASIQSLQVKF